MKSFFIFITLLITLCPQHVSANSCCGQSPSTFTVITSQQKVMINTSYSYVRGLGRVYDNSDEFYIWQNKKRDIQAYQVSAAVLLTDKQQLFLTSSLLNSFYSDPYGKQSAQNLSDTLLGYSYEILPEYAFSYWRPEIYLSALLNFPTGHSINDDHKTSEGFNVTGHNQWGAGLGLTLKKVYFPLTVTLQTRVLRLFSKSFRTVNVSDFYDFSSALITSYSLPWWATSLNTGIIYNNLSSRQINPSQTSSGISQNTNLIIGFQKVVDEHWNFGFNFSDQSLLGRAKNTVLNQTYSLNLSYNYF